MEMCAVLLKPCKGSHGFQGVPDHNLKLYLRTLKERLVEMGFQEKVCVDIIMVMEKEELEFTIYPSGKFLIKPAHLNGSLTREHAENEANALLRIFDATFTVGID